VIGKKQVGLILTLLLTWPILAMSMAGEQEKNFTAEQTFLFNVIKNRRSVRAYKSTPVPKAHILQILDMARMAPTSGNQQPWKFLVVQSREKLAELKAACINRSLNRLKMNLAITPEKFKQREKRIKNYYQTCLSAPVFIVVLVDKQCKYPSYTRHDGPLAAANLIMAARALGYGTVYYTDSIPSDITQKVLGIPERYERICITPLGIPVEWPKQPAKKELKDFVVFEQFAEGVNGEE